jgi:hypothetical protein
MTNARPVTARARPRNVDLVPDAAEQRPIRDRAEDAAREYYQQNKVKNAANTAAEKAKKECHRLMAEGELLTFDFTVEMERGLKTVTALIASEDTTEISVQKVFDEFGIEGLLSVCSVSQTALKDKFGTNAVAACSIPKTKEPSLSIKDKKA